MASARHSGIAGGIALAAAALVVAGVTLHPEGLNAPVWVAYLAAGMFALAGVSALAQALNRKWVAHALACVLLGAMLLMELWIAFGPGVRRCLIGIPGLAMLSADRACRSAFGLGALLVGVMLVMAIRGGLDRRPGG